MTFGESLVKLGKELKGCSGGESVGKAGQSFVSAGVVLRHDRLAGGSDGCTEVIHHGGHKWAR